MGAHCRGRSASPLTDAVRGDADAYAALADRRTEAFHVLNETPVTCRDAIGLKTVAMLKEIMRSPGAGAEIVGALRAIRDDVAVLAE